MSTTVGREVAGAERSLGMADLSLGAADCEVVGQGVLAQPVAALSSVAFVVVAGWLAWTVRGLAPRQRLAAWVVAGPLALVGLGSIGYHGPQAPGAQLLHDASVVLVLLAAVRVPAARALRRSPVLTPASRPWLVVAGVAAAVALPAYLLGRTGGVLCSPESVLQLHAVWHVAAAVTVGAWGRALWPDPSADRATGGSVRRRQEVRATS